MDVLLLSERIRKTIELGESQFREFKSAWEGTPSQKKSRDPKMVARDIAETLVAFANADGGELLIGVEDDGTISGINFKDNVISNLFNTPTTGIHPDTPLDKPICRKVDIDGKELLYFSVEKSTTKVHQTSNGKCLQRMDLENRPVAFENLVFERQEQISREYDRQFIEGALVSDLNISLIKKVSNQITNMSPEKCLQYLGLAEYGVGMLKLKRACLLLFANDISRWHPRCQVRVLRIRGTELKTGLDYNVVSDEIANGNVLEIINSAWEKLRPHLVETKMDNDALFRVRVMYPEHACREALINAISHRDYSLEGQNIEIYIYDDRIEVKSPGGLLSGIKIEDLKKMQGIHESRNANIARTLRELGYMQEMGEGIRRIFCLMQDADLIPPDLIADKNRFSIVLHHKSVFSDKDQRLLDGYKQFKLTKEEKLIILLGKEGNLLTSQQIYDELDLKDWDVFRKIVEQIQIKGILYNKISQSKKALLAREQKVSKRKIPRLQVRQPESVENALNEVITIFREQERVKVVDNNYLKNIFNSLPENNLYRKYFPNLSRLLIILGFITKNRKPTTKLLEIWDK